MTKKGPFFGPQNVRESRRFFFLSDAFMAFARSIHRFVLAGNYCEKHAKPSLWMAAKESKCGPLHSPYAAQVP